MKSGAALLQFPESAVSREPTCARHGEHTLASRPDLIAELERPWRRAYWPLGSGSACGNASKRSSARFNPALAEYELSPAKPLGEVPRMFGLPKTKYALLIAALFLLSIDASAAEDLNSANWFMTSCREAVAGSEENLFYQGYCVGYVTATVETLQSTVMCAPREATERKAVGIVVKYIDDRPARQHENFRSLLREALIAAWPCK